MSIWSQLLDIDTGEHRDLELADGSEQRVETDDLWLFPGWIDLRAADSSVESRIFSRVLGGGGLPVAPLLEDDYLADMGSARAQGAVAFVHGGSLPADTRLLELALRYAAQLGLPVLLYPVEAGYEDAIAHAGRVATRLGLSASPHAAETIAVLRLAELARETGARVHLLGLSSERALDALRAAKASHVSITAQVEIAHLFLTDVDICDFRSEALTRLPLREVGDRAALIEGLRDGSIDVLASGHVPPAASSDSFVRSPRGCVTAEAFPGLVGRLHREHAFEPRRLLEVLSRAPREILRVEVDEDWTIFAPQRSYAIDDPDSAFDGWEFEGAIAATVRAGGLVYRGGDVSADSSRTST